MLKWMLRFIFFIKGRMDISMNGRVIGMMNSRLKVRMDCGMDDWING